MWDIVIKISAIVLDVALVCWSIVKIKKNS